MNPTTAVRLQGYRIAFPGYLPWSPGSAIPFGGPQKQLALYQDFNWVKGRHDLRFGGYYMHMNDDRTFGAYDNSVESLNTTSAALPSLDSFVRGQIQRYPGRDRPRGLPRRYVHDAGRLPELPEQQQVRRVRPLRERHVEHHRPPEAEPRPAVRVLRPPEEERAEVRLELLLQRPELLGEHQLPHADHRLHPRRPDAAVEREPDRAALEERLEQLRPARGLRLRPQRRREDVPPRRLRHGLRAQLRQRHLQRALQPAAVSRRLDRRPDGHAGATGLRRQPGPVRRRRRRDEDDPRGQPAPHRPEHGDGLQPLLQPVDPARGRREHGGQHRVHRLHGPQPLRPRRPEQARRGARLRGHRDGQPAADHAVRGLQHPRQPRPVAVPRRDVRHRLAPGRQHRPAVLGEVHALAGEGQPQLDLLRLVGANFNLGYVDAFDPMLDYGYSEFDVRHRAIVSFIWELPIFRNSEGAVKTLLGGWQLAGLFTARTGRPFTLWDCTNRSTTLHARRGPGRDQQERDERVRPRPTRTSSCCSTSRRSPARRVAT